MKSIMKVLMDRDGITAQEAAELIKEAKEDFQNRLIHPQDYGDPYEVCADHFGLEPDYIMELI